MLTNLADFVLKAIVTVVHIASVGDTQLILDEVVLEHVVVLIDKLFDYLRLHTAKEVHNLTDSVFGVLDFSKLF